MPQHRTTRPSLSPARDRRAFLGHSGRIGLLGLAAGTLSATAESAVEPLEAPAPQPGRRDGRGYEETERMRTYYRLAGY